MQQEATTQNTQTTIPECPECAGRLDATPTMLGELVDCPDCGAELETVSTKPLSFAVAPELEEDWGE